MADVGALEAHLRERRDAGRKLLVPYVTGGLGSDWAEVVRAFAAAGADAIEVGIPFSDPVMDGPTIQAAADEALTAGFRVRDVFTVVEAITKVGGKAVVMTYWNLVLKYGVDNFARDLAAAGGLGIITPDLIPDEAADWIAASDRHGLDRIFLGVHNFSDVVAGYAVGFLWLFGAMVFYDPAPRSRVVEEFSSPLPVATSKLTR